MASSMERVKKVVNEKHERILLELTKQSGNDVCADCGSKGPRWASHNIGIFLCIRCGGLHRKMGTHISKNMRQWGNLKANFKWNPHPEIHPAPVNASDSYNSNNNNNDHAPNYDNSLRQLRDMGFTDNTKNREILNTTKGNLSSAIEILVRLPPPSSSNSTAGDSKNSISNTTTTTATSKSRISTNSNASSNSLSSSSNIDDKLVQLWNMGFQDEPKNREALRRTGGNLEVAAALLLEARQVLQMGGGSDGLLVGKGSDYNIVATTGNNNLFASTIFNNNNNGVG
ncbi:4439_t:CDS:2 [Entrophospora sp. SA101]|nr:4656_t:CDS:2 [Entrophospora sp. SA101]CAJ0754908.1 4439_t:CDS:2 [Entrophospora sp. SA101]CAJ0881835.1 11370_t:CDS:2 [Entrophospora sp. SA101]